MPRHPEEGTPMSIKSDYSNMNSQTAEATLLARLFDIRNLLHSVDDPYVRNMLRDIELHTSIQGWNIQEVESRASQFAGCVKDLATRIESKKPNTANKLRRAADIISGKRGTSYPG